ncbi:MAG: GAF domain-containing protein [Planctomycetota bacterium]
MTQTLLAAAELWCPTTDGGPFALDQGVYGGCEALRTLAERPTSEPDVTLVAEVFDQGRPRVVTDLNDLGFMVAEAAASDGVTAALLLPSFVQGEVDSVLVFYFRGGNGFRGAVELWAGTKGRFELSLDQSYYAGLDRFARISRYVNFPKGSGLPGQCWDLGMPRIVPDVKSAKGFLRSSGAESDGLSVGLGVPVMCRTELRSVLLLLSSSATPVARVHEVWIDNPAPEGPGKLTRSQGVYGGLDALAAASGNQTFSTSGEGLVERAWSSARPVMAEGEALAAAGAERLAAIREAQLGWAVACPVVVVDQVRAVVLLMG